MKCQPISVNFYGRIFADDIVQYSNFHVTVRSSVKCHHWTAALMVVYMYVIKIYQQTNF